MTTPPRRHHHVWQFHLRAWSTKGKLWCKQDGRTFNPNTKNIAQKRDFYKLNELSEDDIEFVRMFAVKQSLPSLVDVHERWINMFTAVHKARNYVERRGADKQSLSKLVRKLELEIEEQIHGRIETAALPILNSMRGGDISFWDNEEKCMTLLHFMATQYYRTNAMRQRMERVLEPLAISNIKKTWNLISHIYATNLAANIHSTREEFRPCLISSEDGASLITGDQPIINVHSTANEDLGVRPDYLDLYFPIGPKQALILCDVNGGSPFQSGAISNEVSSHLNKRIAGNTFAQIYGTSEAAIEPYTPRGLVFDT